MAKLVHKEQSYTGGGSSGLLPHIVITSDAENTITVTTPSGSTITPTSTVSGVWECDGDEYGTYTITATYDEYEAEDTVVVDTVKVYAVEIHIVTIPDGSTVLPTDDVATWLLCADIKDKSYTTLSDVLSDSETFNALLGDSNACAYMARSTTWTTDICADQYAMSMIGQYDVCCDALLGNATWASAIAASDYADYVITYGRGFVPVMTSNTAPSGTVSASNENTGSGHPAYHAFDDNNSTFWSTVANSIPAHITYTFSTAQKVTGVYIKPYYTGGYCLKDFVIRASDDGFVSDTHDLYSGTYDSNSTAMFVVLNNADNYTSFRLYATNSNTNYVALESLQFYGEITSGEYIHGTNNESAYYLDGATQTPIVDPSTLSAGTYTFGSTKAKNPSDLTADYTKTIRITPNTKEIVLRPDKTLYWWGYMSKGCEELLTANGWSQSNYSLISPTYDDYDVLCSAPSASQTCGIGSKYAVDLTSVSCISQGITIQSSEYGQYAAWTDKSGSAAAGGIAEWVTSSNMETHTVSSVSQVTGYPIFIALNKRAIKFFACWYE